MKAKKVVQFSEEEENENELQKEDDDDIGEEVWNLYYKKYLYSTYYKIWRISDK